MTPTAKRHAAEAFASLMARDPFMMARYGAGAERCPIVTAPDGTGWCLFHAVAVRWPEYVTCAARNDELTARRTAELMADAARR